MRIYLVKETKGTVTHGSETLKKTGCGINLKKAGAASEYEIGETIHDLKEITCAKCKDDFAKRMIKEGSTVLRS
jgi:hypothetical protein